MSGAKEIAGHGVAHESKAEESKFCHRILLSLNSINVALRKFADGKILAPAARNSVVKKKAW
jgi:hypothetical protein